MSRGSSPLRRSGGHKPPRRTIDIYCEGELTERLYFGAIRAELRGRNIAIQINPACGGNPYEIVTRAQQGLRTARSSNDLLEGDETWAVFDVESPQRHVRILDAIGLAQAQGINCAISNPCFELWLLLHFRDCRKYLTTADAERLLEELKIGYTRKKKRFNYNEFEPRYLEARANAIKLNGSPLGENGHEVNPSTSVWCLVDSMRSRNR